MTNSDTPRAQDNMNIGKWSLHFFTYELEHSDSLYFWYSWDQAIEILPAFTSLYNLHETDFINPILYLKSSLTSEYLLE